MTLQTQTPRVVIIGNGTRGPYSFTDASSQAIRATATSHIRLTRYSTSTADNNDGTLLVEGTDYTVGGTQDARTFTLAAGQAVLTSNQRIVAERVQNYSQDLSLTTGGAFNAAAVEARIDKISEFQQELKARLDRVPALQFADATANVAFPSPPTSATQFLARNTAGEIAYATAADLSVDVTLGSDWETILGLPAAGILDNLSGVRYVATYAALTALTTASGLADNAVYYTYARTTEEDGGAGFWRYDSASTSTANGGTILAIDGGGAGRFFRLFNPAEPVNAQWFGFKVGGGNSDATANTTALQAALDANYWVQLPEGTAYINKITHTRSNRLSGAGQSATILYRANSLNDYALFASAKNDMIYEDFTLNMNRANNTGSGNHGGIRLESACSRWQLRRVKVTGARGLFSGSPVGAGFSSVGGGSNGQFDNCWFDDCYDGYVLSAHTDARDFGTWLTANTRNGGLVAAASDRFEAHGVYAVGNSTTYVGAGLQIIDSPDSKTYGGTFNSNTLGHGLQYNGADRCEVHGGTFNGNGISGLDFFDCVDGKVFGGYAASNTVRGIEIDSASNGFIAVGFQGVSNVDVDISVFRTADAQLIGCEGNVRGWDSGSVQLGSAIVSAGGTGYTVGDVLTIVGGTKATAATLTVATLSGSAVATVTVSNQGDYWTFPTEPASVTGGTGSGATFTFTGSAEASSTCARLQIIGGHRSDTLNFVTDACTEIRLTNVKATTITDASNEIVSAIGCDNIETIFALADVATYADQAAAATAITGVGRLFRFNTTGALGITLT